jgi:predicted nucleotidyltransferase
MEIEKIPEKYQSGIKKAVNLFKNEGCKSVFLFGSMVTGKIHPNSDIDIGITGLAPKKYFL